MEEKIGYDLNGDGRIGGPGVTAQAEQATHFDINGDGRIGGYRPPPPGSSEFLFFSVDHFVISSSRFNWTC